MKIKLTKNKKINLELSWKEYSIISGIVNEVNNTCFQEQNENKEWESNGYLAMILSEEEKTTLEEICENI